MVLLGITSILGGGKNFDSYTGSKEQRWDETPCIPRPMTVPFLHIGCPDGEGNFDLGIEKGKVILFWRMRHFWKGRPGLRGAAVRYV